MRRYITFIVSFSMLFISWLPMGKSAQAKQIDAITATQSSSPILLKQTGLLYIQNEAGTQVAEHSSHRSHYSHSSHRSHYSSRY